MTLLVVLLAAGAPAPAWGQSGNGLYEPFPAPAAPSQARAYLAQLGVEAGDRQLRHGVVRGGLPAGAARAASGRAGVTGPHQAPIPALLLLTLVPLAIAVPLGLGRRR
jgi:hypothetical protein